MLTCRVKPVYNTCLSCVDHQIEYNIEKDCKDCDLLTDRLDIVKLGVGLFGKPYAMVLAGGKIEKIPLNRLYDVQSVRRINYETYYD